MRTHVIAAGALSETALLMLPIVASQAEIALHTLPAPQASLLARFWPFNSAITPILQQIPANEPVIFADWPSVLHAPKRWIASRECAHLLTELPNSSLHGGLGSYASKPLIIHAASQVLADFAQKTGVDPKLIRVTRPAFPLLPTPEQTNPTFMLGTTCSLLPNQGLETVLQAMHDCRELLPQLKLTVIGDGPDKRRVLWLIDQLGLKGRVHIAANAADYQRFIGNFDIFIAATPYDTGFNPMIGHALSRSVPVIATKLPSHEEWINHGQTGLLYEAGNAAMLGQHILNLYNHPDWMAHYKKSGPEVIRAKSSSLI